MPHLLDFNFRVLPFLVRCSPEIASPTKSLSVLHNSRAVHTPRRKMLAALLFNIRAMANNSAVDSTSGTQSCPPPALPTLVAEQHVPIAAQDKSTQRLIVVLSNASLETYKSSHGGGRDSRGGPVKDEKYSLLNSDEHIGVLRKMNRDISNARPDITHQVCIHLISSELLVRFALYWLITFSVFSLS